jgi:hypothetical protein
LVVAGRTWVAGVLSGSVGKGPRITGKAFALIAVGLKEPRRAGKAGRGRRTVAVDIRSRHAYRAEEDDPHGASAVDDSRRRIGPTENTESGIGVFRIVHVA